MQCSKCNNFVPEGYKFCVRCGQPVAATPVIDPMQTQIAGAPAVDPMQTQIAGQPPVSVPYAPTYQSSTPNKPLQPLQHQGSYQHPYQPPPQVGYAGFECTIEHGSAFALAVVKLSPEQSIKAEAGAMVSMSPNIELQSQVQGGLMGVLKRAVVGESIFINTFTARGGPGEVTLAPPAPGDIKVIDLNNQVFLVQSGSFLACSPAVNMDTQFGGAKSFFSGEGLFLAKFSGFGKLLVCSYGAIRHKRLAPGERYIVDTSHIVAFEATVQYQIKKASQQGFFRSLTSGEGLVCEYMGPGDIYLQTRSLEAFVGVLKPFFPTSSGG
ncbi:MAG: TIGR00266 family protein [Acidobacteriota bacterium]|nr:TIGR00266 family protein [Blastocatellia bacterium]MDW8413649.1 TIGR00266 family protein [Acidobacteriota bacterium]